MEYLKFSSIFFIGFIFLLFFSVFPVSAGNIVEFNVSLKADCPFFTWPEQVEKVKHVPGTNFFRIWVDEENATHVLDLLKNSDDVIFIEKVKAVRLQSDSSLTQYEWEDIIDKEKLTAISTGLKTVVAVLDTGIDLDNLLLNSILFVNSGEILGDGVDNDKNGYIDDISGWDMGDMDNIPMDENEHGTMVSSIILRLARDCKVLPVKLDSGSSPYINSGALAEAIFYAVNMGADVINLSLTVPDGSLAVANAIKTAFDAGCTIIGAAGNSGDSVEFPATMDEVVAVGAMYDNDTIAYWFSPHGPELDIVAPGVAVDVTSLGNTASLASGTSFSAPMVSGAAAVLKSKFPLAASSYITSLLYSGTRDLGTLGRDDIFGYGVLDGGSLLNAVYNTYEHVGSLKGIINKNVNVTDNYFCILNMNPEIGDVPVQQWIIIGGTQGGTDFSFFFNGKKFIDWDTAIKFPEIARADVTTADKLLTPLIPELNLGRLGYSKSSEKLWYCYAYTTNQDTSLNIMDIIDLDDFIVKNIVSLIVSE